MSRQSAADKSGKLVGCLVQAKDLERDPAAWSYGFTGSNPTLSQNTNITDDSDPDTSIQWLFGNWEANVHDRSTLLGHSGRRLAPYNG